MNKLINVQAKLKAPKSQRNDFAHYDYRSCEDILQAVKPLLKEEGLLLTISDSIEMVGNRVYVKATATVTDGEKSFSTTAYAREDEIKKGMDGSQLTGAASSYARKYALNGLFAIDDTKDADANKPSDDAKQTSPSNHTDKPQNTAKTNTAPSSGGASDAQIKAIYAISKQKGKAVPDNLKSLSSWQAGQLIKDLQSA